MAPGINPLTGRPGPAPHPPRDGDKKQARQRVNVEVAHGRRPHPNSLPCADCGHIWKPRAARRHEYHHHRGYGAAHHLDVIPLCTRCHSVHDGKRTHCLKGHEFTSTNTYLRSNGTRACRECHRIWDRARPPRGSDYWRTVNRRRGRSHG